jgi:hypothetical protein
LSDLSKRAAIAAGFPTINFPAFDKSWRKIVWSRRGPTIDDRLRKEPACFNLGSIWRQVASNFASIKPDELLVSTF